MATLDTQLDVQDLLFEIEDDYPYTLICDWLEQLEDGTWCAEVAEVFVEATPYCKAHGQKVAAKIAAA